MFCLHFFFLAVLGVFGLFQAQKQDYCASNLCPSGGTNVCCNNTGEFATTCRPGTTLVDITAEMQAAILKSHNDKRNQLAAGNLSNFASAVRMGTMRWVPELVDTSTCNRKQCYARIDSCRSTQNFRYSGQNIGMSFSVPSISDESCILRLINNFWNYNMFATMEHINSYPTNTTVQRKINTFTLLAKQNNVGVGCSVSKFIDPETFILTRNLTCNYASNNYINRSIYEAGPPASKCTTGTNPEYPYLCSVDEQYDLTQP